MSGTATSTCGLGSPRPAFRVAYDSGFDLGIHSDFLLKYSPAVSVVSPQEESPMRNRSQSVKRNEALRTPVWFALAAILALPPLTVSICSANPNGFATVVSPVLQKHCIKCHGADDVVEGETNLSKLTNDALTADAELVRRLIEVIDQREMPPEDEPPIDPQVRRKLVAELRTTLHAAVANQRQFPHTPIRRMNRFQYNNAVTDLFDLKCICLLYTSPSPRDATLSRMPSSA